MCFIPPKVRAMIVLGVAANGFIKTRTMACIIAVKDATPSDIHVACNDSCYVPLNRQKLAQYAVDSGATHLFFVDTDMIFPSGTLVQLLKTGKYIVGASYNMRLQGTQLTTTNIINAAGEVETLKETPTELTQVNSIGTGLLLINTHVFKHIPKPWFTLVFDETGKLTHGEDIWFCQKARETGYEIWSAPIPGVGHIGDYVY